MSHWNMVPFETLYSEPSRNGIYKSNNFHGSGVKIVNMGELFAFEFIGKQVMKRLQLTALELERSKLIEGDLLFGRRSLVEAGAGKCSIVEQVLEDTTFESSLIRVRLNQQVAIPRFYYYWLKSPSGRGTIKSIVTGTNVKGIKGSDLRRVQVVLPLLDEQKSIVNVIQKYDDLIENNRRRIELLEQSARILFREWFVYLRFPGHEHMHFTDGLPEGWQISAFSQIANFMNGYPFKPEDLMDEGIPIVKIPELRDGILEKTPKNSGDMIKEKYFLNTGDLLFSWSGTLLINLWASGPALLNQHLFKVTSLDTKKVSLPFLHYALKEMLDHFMSQTTGATMKHIRMSALDSVKVHLPSVTLMEQFTEIAGNIDQQIIHLRQSNATLVKGRDLLIARIMNGEITV